MDGNESLPVYLYLNNVRWIVPIIFVRVWALYLSSLKLRYVAIFKRSFFNENVWTAKKFTDVYS